MIRYLKGILRVIVLYVLAGISLYFVLDMVNRTRVGLENRWEAQYGPQILDREPPYSWREQVIRLLDIEPGIYWQEAAAMAAIMAVPVTFGLSLSAFYKGRRRKGFFLLAGMILNGFVLGAVSKIPEMESLNITFAGYLIANRGAIVLPAVVCGAMHGWFAFLLWGGSNKSGGLDGFEVQNENHGET